MEEKNKKLCYVTTYIMHTNISTYTNTHTYLEVGQDVVLGHAEEIKHGE